MRRIHFIQAKSRLGTPHTPWRSKQSSKGVELAPGRILSSEFLSQFVIKPSVTFFSFPDPGQVGQTEYFYTLARALCYFSDTIYSSVSPQELQVVIGGDHSVTLGSLMALFKRFNPKDAGYLQIDSHVDLLTYKRSVTKNFHGMFNRVLMDTFDIPIRDKLVPNKLPTSNVAYIGNFELDKEEKDFLSSKKIFTLTRAQIREKRDASLARLKNFISHFHHIHVSFDIDCFDKTFAPATGTPSLSGLYPKNIFFILHELAKYKNTSVDLVEVTPQRLGARKTIHLARKILFALLEDFVKK